MCFYLIKIAVALLFFLMVVASLTYLTFTVPSVVLSTMLAASSSGVELALTLAGIYIVWMGVIQVAIDAGLIDALARACRPVIRFLFGPQTDEVNALLAANISANMIGAGNAATPAAIEAIRKMSSPDQTRASQPMIMLFILSATSMQILPTTVLGILEEAGAANAAGIILPTIITSGLITVMGVILVKVFGAKLPRQPLQAVASVVLSVPQKRSSTDPSPAKGNSASPQFSRNDKGAP